MMNRGVLSLFLLNTKVGKFFLTFCSHNFNRAHIV